MLTAHILGRFCLSDPLGADVSPRSRKARALLGYLLLSDLGSERREKLAGLLWSESSGEQAYDSLRHCLSELRRVERTTGIGFLRADRQRVGIDRGRLNSDLALLRSQLATGDVTKCRQLLASPDLALLAGTETGDPAFDNWLLVERERTAEGLVQEMLSALATAGIAPRERKDLVRAIECLDPYQEDAVRTHMVLLAAEGNFAGAMACYEGYRHRLAREYEVEPSEELIDFAETLAGRGQPEAPPPGVNGNGASRSRAATAAVAASQPAGQAAGPSTGRGTPIIAVLPLPNVPIAEDLRPVADAFSHELVSTLCRFKEWTVIAPNGSFEEAAGAGPLDATAKLADTGVDYALMTSVSAVAASTVLNVRLIECDTQMVVISDQYPASSENWPAVFNDICCRIASRTQVGVAASRLRRVSGRSPDRRKAYDLWLEGETLSWLWTKPTEEQAVALFQQAISLDDQLACAYGSWAAVLNTRWIIYPGWPEDDADRQQAYDLARRAVALDPLDCRNHMHLGWSHLLARRFEPGELHFQLAHDLNPSNPDNLLVCGLASAFCGRHERAKALCDRAFDLNPFRPALYWGYRSTVLLLGRDFQGCIAAVANAPDIFPDIQGWAAIAYAHLGRPEEARRALHQFFADIRAQWARPAAPSDEELRRWFVEVFPIRAPEDRQLLRDGLQEIP